MTASQPHPLDIPGYGNDLQINDTSRAVAHGALYRIPGTHNFFIRSIRCWERLEDTATRLFFQLAHGAQTLASLAMEITTKLESIRIEHFSGGPLLDMPTHLPDCSSYLSVQEAHAITYCNAHDCSLPTLSMQRRPSTALVSGHRAWPPHSLYLEAMLVVLGEAEPWFLMSPLSIMTLMQPYQFDDLSAVAQYWGRCNIIVVSRRYHSAHGATLASLALHTDYSHRH
jgi:hypothetical protein